MKQSGQLAFTLFILLAMTAWGGSWTSAKFIAPLAPPEVLIFWRFLFTSLSFIPIMMFYKGSYRLNLRSVLPIILGAVFIVTYNKFFFWGLQYGLAGAGGVLVTTLNPILTFLFTIVFFAKRASLREFSGLILGFAGGAVLLGVWGVSLNQLFRSGNAYFLFASTAWALLTLTSEKSRSNLPPLVFSFYVFGLSAFLDFFLALPLGIDHVLTEDWLFWTNILYLSVFATTFATTIYFAASGRLGSRRASSYIFLVPASTVLISWVLLGEQPRLSTLVGGLIALSAVYLINVSPKGSPQADLSTSNQ